MGTSDALLKEHVSAVALRCSLTLVENYRSRPDTRAKTVVVQIIIRIVAESQPFLQRVFLKYGPITRWGNNLPLLLILYV